MRCIIGHRVDYDGAGFLRGQRYIYAAKIDLKTPPPLIYQEIVPFQSEYKHSTIIWDIPLLNGFNGSVFLSELFGCHCFTNVCVVSFQTIWFSKWFWQHSSLLLCLEPLPAHAWICFYNQKMEFFKCLTQLDGCRVSGHTMPTWFWTNWVFVCFLLFFSYC